MKLFFRRTQIDEGLISIIAPPSNIYPPNNFYLMTRRPFNNTIERMEWQVSNLVLFTIQPMAILVYVLFQIGITYIAVCLFRPNCHWILPFCSAFVLVW